MLTRCWCPQPLPDHTNVQDDETWLKAGVNPSQEKMRARSSRSMADPDAGKY